MEKTRVPKTIADIQARCKANARSYKRSVKIQRFVEDRHQFTERVAKAKPVRIASASV